MSASRKLYVELAKAFRETREEYNYAGRCDPEAVIDFLEYKVRCALGVDNSSFSATKFSAAAALPEPKPSDRKPGR